MNDTGHASLAEYLPIILARWDSSGEILSMTGTPSEQRATGGALLASVRYWRMST